jgi:formylglycine-generating enzyme required for sulfatase activity
VQSSLGLYDLSGNVSEWCQTNWSEEGYRADNDPEGSATLAWGELIA